MPANLFVADFIGDANLVEGDLVEERGSRGLVRLGTTEIELLRRGMGLGPVKLAIRPDGIVLHPTAPSGPAEKARIAKSSYLGKHVEYTVASALGSLFVIDRGRGELLSPDTEVWMSFSERDIAVVPRTDEQNP